MALNDKAFAAVLQGIFDDMWNIAENNKRSNSWYAEQLAKAINDEIRNGDVQPGIPGTNSTTTGIGKIK